MGHSHCTQPELGLVQGMVTGAMDTNTMYVVLLYRNVHTGLRQGKLPRSIVSCCAGPVPCTYAGSVPVQCE